MMNDTVIEVRGLVTRFGKQVVHDHLDMELKRGEIMGLVGGSGSGKSVLLRSILGLIKPAEGDIVVKARDGSTDEAYKNWGILFQNGALFSGLNVLDNIILPIREHYKLPESEMEALAVAKLGMVGLAPEVAYKKPSELSGGMVKRAALARALALDPEILFLDEPTAGLDPIAAASFDELIRTLRDLLGLSVLIITHDLDTLTSICDRIAMLVDKKITSGTLDDMMRSDHPWIKEYFTGPRMRAVLQEPGKV
ncbi:MAG: ABC transporter ATP-binding protein [Micavibrio aeruginosavorus]|uniref:ABC transporter ATP-binding protein n=1 Tax=Micavibrio aeruginosavorus TaxID=349221 RepID=A0A2W5A6Y4_9BACT|nr:MAG: ABC transporter ATP-binding protein [Micavibrio aeruginosavorus]